MKKFLSIIFYYTGISYFLFRLIHTKGKIRAVNYHCTPTVDLNNFKKHLIFYKKYLIVCYRLIPYRVYFQLILRIYYITPLIYMYCKYIIQLNYIDYLQK